GRNGQGFHAYDWVNPASGQPEPKISYSIDLPKWQWVIGAGIYVTDVDEAVAAAQLEIDEAIRASLQYILLTTLIIVVIAILLGLFVGRTVTRPLNTATSMMREIASGDGDLTQRLPEQGRDELSELGRQFNAFVTKIQRAVMTVNQTRSEEHTSELQSRENLVCRLRSPLPTRFPYTTLFRSLFVGRTVTRPLNTATSMMREIASGDGDLTQRLPEQGRDELSELGRQFNAFVTKIQRAVMTVNQT